MRKIAVVHKKEPLIADGVSVRVRFASHAQLDLIRTAAKRRGVSRDRLIQNVLQAVAEQILAEPLPPPLEQLAKAAIAQL